MKTLIITLSVAIAFILSSCSSSKHYEEALLYQEKIIKLQSKALEKADSIIETNNLYDTDGSDTMSEYLELKGQINSITK